MAPDTSTIEQTTDAPASNNPPLTPQEAKVAGIQRMRALLKAAKLRGNPKDFVVVTENSIIADWERAVRIQAQIPAHLEPDNHVWTLDRDGKLAAVRIKDDQGEKVLVTNDHSEWFITRAEMYPTALPLRPTLFHKSKLRHMVGDRVGSMFWNHNVGVRVNKPGELPDINTIARDPQ